MKTDEPPLPHQSVKEPAGTDTALERVVASLSDPMQWNWCENFHNKRCAANEALSLMARVGLIEHQEHNLGGDVWRVNGKLYGRTDDEFEWIETPPGKSVPATPDKAPMVSVSSKKETLISICPNCHKSDEVDPDIQDSARYCHRCHKEFPAYNPSGAAVGASTKEEDGFYEWASAQGWIQDECPEEWAEGQKIWDASLASRGQE